MAVQTGNTDKLAELLQPHRQSMDVLQEALKEVSAEQAEERKTKAKELIRQALDLQRQMNAAESQFLQAKGKFDKQLGKVMKQLQRMASNQPADQAGDDEPDEAEAAE
jgi:hypothetical protein